MSVQKRLREQKKAEQAELKRASRRAADTGEAPRGGQVADRGELEGYGIVPAASDPRDDR
jgi:hypothetical protein